MNITTTDRDRFARIVDALRPGSRRCTVTCPIHGFDQRRNDPRYIIPHCDLCDGHRVVFREDPEGRELIDNAIYEWFYILAPEDLAKWSLLAMERFNFDWKKSNGECLWLNRFNQPWQAAIEQHVRDYEAEPPDLRTAMVDCPDGSKEMLLERMLREATHHYTVSYWPDRKGFASQVLGIGLSHCNPTYADTRAAALIAAVEAALGLTQTAAAPPKGGDAK